ncbi:MAG: DUF2480 family protein [Flavobacteriaceae bacterium]|nr:DUF2480 family protein [Flavobacteriaceae bacterium]
MDEPILNRVSNSSLITINLEDLRIEGIRFFFDLKNIMENGVIIRENKIREFIKEHDWTQYSNQFVAVGCSTEVILPSWAKLLIATSLKHFAKKVVIGNLEQLETVLFERVISELDCTEYQNKPIVIKGCSDQTIPDSAYGFLINKLQGYAKKISYGEACSSVPLWSSNK